MSKFKIGEPLPPWILEATDGQPAPDVESYKGKPLIILIFNLGCPGCKWRAIPFANRLVYEEGDFLQVVGIHTHFEGPDFTDEQIKSAKEEHYIRFPIFRDGDLAATYYNYQAAGTPHWILVDKGGTVIDSIFGSDPNRALLRIHYHVEQLKSQE